MDHFGKTHWFYLQVPCDWLYPLTGRAKDGSLCSWSVAAFASRWSRCAQVSGKLQQWKSRLMSQSFTSGFKLACSHSHSGGCVLPHTSPGLSYSGVQVRFSHTLAVGHGNTMLRHWGHQI